MVWGAPASWAVLWGPAPGKRGAKWIRSPHRSFPLAGAEAGPRGGGVVGSCGWGRGREHRSFPEDMLLGWGGGPSPQTAPSLARKAPRNPMENPREVGVRPLLHQAAPGRRGMQPALSHALPQLLVHQGPWVTLPTGAFWPDLCLCWSLCLCPREEREGLGTEGTPTSPPLDITFHNSGAVGAPGTGTKGSPCCPGHTDALNLGAMSRAPLCL